MFFFADVPEGSFIVREHTPMSNLFSCLWFNEVERFTPRDQLSFAYTYQKLIRMNPDSPINLHMFKVRIPVSKKKSSMKLYDSTLNCLMLIVWSVRFRDGSTNGVARLIMERIMVSHWPCTLINWWLDQPMVSVHGFVESDNTNVRLVELSVATRIKSYITMQIGY